MKREGKWVDRETYRAMRADAADRYLSLREPLPDRIWVEWQA